MRLLVSGCTATVRKYRRRWRQNLGHLLTPNNGNSIKAIVQSGLPWAADNAAFSSFNAEKYQKMLTRIALQPRCLFVVCPDVVGDARATLDLFGEWALTIRATGQPIAFVGQDGAENICLPWNDFYAWFIGGTDDWKLSRASVGLALEAKDRGKWVHMGRVNSFLRIRQAIAAGCDSFDGGSASMFGETYIPRYCRFIDHCQRQKLLF